MVMNHASEFQLRSHRKTAAPQTEEDREVDTTYSNRSPDTENRPTPGPGELRREIQNPDLSQETSGDPETKRSKIRAPEQVLSSHPHN